MPLSELTKSTSRPLGTPPAGVFGYLLGHIPIPRGQIVFETLPETGMVATLIALAAQLRWKELICAPSFTWYGVLGGETE